MRRGRRGAAWSQLPAGRGPGRAWTPPPSSLAFLPLLHDSRQVRPQASPWQPRRDVTAALPRAPPGRAGRGRAARAPPQPWPGAEPAAERGTWGPAAGSSAQLGSSNWASQCPSYEGCLAFEKEGSLNCGPMSMWLCLCSSIPVHYSQRKTRPIYTSTGPSEVNYALLQDHCFNRMTSANPGGLQPPFNGTAASTLTSRVSGCILTLSVVFFYYYIVILIFLVKNCYSYSHIFA
ncbi:uncharacterized protein [Taeniopygia guttata]|uniref:uncharacterized protein n=1 Tax=Taeniopygia guttata TaxID=59729 RepID=UPI003BB92A22